MTRPAITESEPHPRIGFVSLGCPKAVGFPGETETDFEVLLDFVSAAQLDRVGCFQYSPVDGAKANDLPDPVPPDVKESRYHRLMQTQLQLSRERLRARIGQRMEVLVDEVANGQATARSFVDAPEIDGRVYLRDAAGLRAGNRCRVLVEEAGDYDVWGRLLDMPALCPTG